MPDLREIITNWQTSAGGGFKSVMYFVDGSIAVNDQRQAVHTLWESIEGELANEVLYFQDNEGRILNAETGALVNSWNDSEPFGGAGTSTSECVADATQALIRWNTNEVMDGRFLKGRTFVPGLAVENLVNGNLSAASQSVFNGALASFVATVTGFAIWHRPRPASTEHPVARAGGSALVESGTVWQELAVLRQRRA